MTFHGLELEFEIFDAETFEAYEEAVKLTKEAAANQSGEGTDSPIRRQCEAVFDFFDLLFGDGFHKQLFGERKNLMECLKAFYTFTQAVEDQRAEQLEEMDGMVEEMRQNASNRAARRAAAKGATA